VLPHVQELVAAVDGRTVVSADHGNMFGERSHPIPDREYGHPARIHTPELIEIPWLTIDADTRRQITTGTSHDDTTDADQQTAADRLTALGYLVD